MFLIRWIQNFFVEIYWRALRAVWRYENRKKAQDELPWWVEWALWFEKQYWKFYPIIGKIRVLLIKVYWKLRYLHGPLMRLTVEFYWLVRRHLSFRLIFVRVYWGLVRALGFLKVSLIRVFWKVRRSLSALRIGGIRLFWKLHQIPGRIPIWKLQAVAPFLYWSGRRIFDRLKRAATQIFWSVYSFFGWISLRGTRIYWLGFRAMDQLISKLRGSAVVWIRGSIFVASIFDYLRGYGIRWYWKVHNSKIWFCFKKIYWFVEYQFKKFLPKAGSGHESGT